MVRLALIGAGRWGKKYFATALHMPGCKITYVCSPHADGNTDIPSDVVRVTDHRDLLQFHDIDGIIIATPPATHISIALTFVKTNIPLLIEKPLSPSLFETLAFREEVKKRKVRVMVGHVYRYHPAFKGLQQKISQIGTPYYIALAGSNGGPVRSDVSVLWDWGPHDISMCLALIGEKPSEVVVWGVKRGWGDVEMVWMRLGFTHGITAIISTGWLDIERKRSLTVVGSWGYCIFDDTKKEKLRWQRNDGVEQVVHVSEKLPLECELEAFIDFIEKGIVPPTTVEEAVDVATVLDAGERSLKRAGRTISLVWKK